MEVLSKLIVTSRGKVEVLGKSKVIDAIGVTKRYTYVSSSPLMYAISLPKVLRLTKVIGSSGCFVVHKVAKDKLVNESEAASLREDQRFSLDVEQAESVDCLRLVDASEYLECEVVNHLVVGDHILFVGAIRKRVW